MGLQAAVGQGPALRGLPGAALLLGVRDAAVELRDRAWTTPTASARTRRSPCGSSSSPTPASADSLLVWTTTPWTLPSNLALAVGPDIDYAVFEEDGARYVLGEATGGDLRAGARGRRAGRHGEGPRARRPPLHAAVPVLRRHRRTPSGCWPPTSSPPRTAPASCTSPPASARTTSGCARPPASPSSCPVDEHGRFTAEVPDYAGLQVFDANPADHHATSRPRASSSATRPTTTPIPHCWRTDTPLIYQAVSSWFVQVTAIKDRMLELNQEITWVPEHVRDGSLRQVARERPRLVDQPQPVLGLAHPGVEERRPRLPARRRLRQPRRARARLRRAPRRPAPPGGRRADPPQPRRPHRAVDDASHPRDVLDCWFESGSMPFAQVHYPFENARVVRAPLPRRLHRRVHRPDARLVLHAARAVDGAVRPAVVPDLHRPRRRCSATTARSCRSACATTPTPYEVFDTYGADAMRWSLLSSAVLRGGDLVVDRAGHRGGRAPGAAARSGTPGTSSRSTPTPSGTRLGSASDAERRPRPLRPGQGPRARRRRRPTQMDAYDLSGASAAIRSFLDSLTNWYIRRSRDRFWAGDADAFDTLLHVPCTCCAAWRRRCCRCSPRTIYRGLTGERSVHLTDWPDADALPADADAGRGHGRGARGVLGGARRSARPRACGCGCRWRRSPSPRPTPTLLAPFVDLIADEVNVRRVELTDDLAATGSFTLQAVPAACGPRLGAETQKVIRAVKQGDWTPRRRHGRRGRHRAARGRVLAASRAGRPRAVGHAARRSRRGRARHRGHARAGARGRGP